jgi:rhodanese-related sulfurtransferase
MTAEQLAGLVKTGQAPLILDVRSSFEFNAGHIAGAVHAPLTAVLDVLAVESCAAGDPVVITCEHGPRAHLARMLLKMRGFRNVELLDGHMARWRRAGLAMEKGR